MAYSRGPKKHSRRNEEESHMPIHFSGLAISVPTISFASNQQLINQRRMVQGEMSSYAAFLERTAGSSRPVQKKIQIHAYNLPSKKTLLHIKHPCEFLLHGSIEVTCIFGNCTVYGTYLEPTHKITVHSIKDSCAYKFRTIGHEHKSKNLRERLNMLSVRDFDHLLTRFKAEDSILLVSEIPLPESLYIYLDSFYMGNSKFSYQELSHCDSSVSYIKMPVEWKRTFKENANMSTMVVGPANVGKSVFIKYTINRWLHLSKTVAYLELDLGQTEFTPPGTLGVTVIDKPIFRPNFLHFRQNDRMIHLGEIDVNKCSRNYIEAVRDLARYVAENFEGVPVVINTMGFIKGLGAHLLKVCSKMLKPALVVEIQSLECHKNFNKPLREAIGNEWSYDSVTLSSATPANIRLTKGRAARDRMLISYFCSELKPPYYVLNAVQPYCIHFHGITIGVVANLAMQDILRALNGSMVSLCDEPTRNDEVYEVSNDDPEWFRVVLNPQVQTCHGLGLVRGIDVDDRSLYLITPINLHEVGNVGMLCMSNVIVPAAIFLKQDGVEGAVPYVADVDDDLALVSVRRRHRPAVPRRNFLME